MPSTTSVKTPLNTVPGTSSDFDAIIVGAGLSGLYQLHRLREMGLKVVAIDTASEVGGTWYWNRYPGARVDSQSYIYQYWFSEDLLREWDWSERFPSQAETERYLNFVADKFDLRRDIRFSTRVTSAEWDEATAHWVVHTDHGDRLTARFFITCAGMLSTPVKPPFPGHEKFKGKIVHTAQWPHEEFDLKGKRVGVIGTGATGIQVIQTIASQVAELKVFQRTPQYAVPMRNERYGKAEMDAWRKRYPELQKRVNSTFAGFDFDFDHGSYKALLPEARKTALEKIWADGSLSFWVGGFPEMLVDEETNAEVSEFVRAKIRARIKDPAVADKLVPRSYGFGTYRVPLETGYYDAYNRDNVELVDVKATPIEAFTENGLLVGGREYPLDVVILATGFDAGTGALTRMGIRGRDGRSLTEMWSHDIRSTLGLQVHGFPNLFTVAGPLAPSTAFCNMATCLQQQVDWVTDTIAYLDRQHRSTIEPTLAKEAEWVEHHDATANATLLVRTNSWYTGANVEGKPRRLLSYIGGVGHYRDLCEELKANGYQGFALA